ncbi:MAG TPA: hypothetical protein VMI12_09210 [Puia sp.]|nr:hypothetical protein [Puia sp.]
MRNRKHLFPILGLLVISSICHAQNKAAWQFRSINQLGLLEGETGSAFQIQTINGAQYKSWFGGIGIGLDYYRFRSIPLFADFRKDFGGKNKFFFIYADGGIHFSWLTDDQKRIYAGYNNGPNDFSNGFYMSAGIGYKIILNGKLAFFISPGYSYKKSEAKTTTTICPFQGPCYINTDRYDYNMSRLSVNAGIEF